MIIGCLLIGVVIAVLSAALSLISGLGLFAAVGFYILGGLLGTVGAACINLLRGSPPRPPRNAGNTGYAPEGLAAKA